MSPRSLHEQSDPFADLFGCGRGGPDVGRFHPLGEQRLLLERLFALATALSAEQRAGARIDRLDPDISTAADLARDTLDARGRAGADALRAAYDRAGAVYGTPKDALALPDGQLALNRASLAIVAFDAMRERPDLDDGYCVKHLVADADGLLDTDITLWLYAAAS